MTRRRRRCASARTAGEMPWALKITVASSGTSSSSSTKWAPLALSASTTCRLWTISLRTYTGGGHTCSASSTMSMARSTPAQKPRGPASTIWASGNVVITPSLEEERDPDHARVRVEAAVRVRGVPVRDVLEAIAGVDRDLVGHEVGQPRAGLEHERERGVDLRH